MADERLATNLYSLWLTGTVYLPAAAESYSDAVTPVNVSSTNDGYVFRKLGFEEESPASEDWGYLRDKAYGILQESTNNLLDIGTALTQIAWNYDDADDETKDLLESHVKNYLDDDGIPVILPSGDYNEHLDNGTIRDFNGSDHIDRAPELGDVSEPSDNPDPDSYKPQNR